MMSRRQDQRPFEPGLKYELILARSHANVSLQAYCGSVDMMICQLLGYLELLLSYLWDSVPTMSKEEVQRDDLLVVVR